MADVFISYKKEDAGRVVRIVEGLRAEGFSVWWDHGIAPGSQWDQTIQQELAAAKGVIAVWSETSVAAPWVKEEAGVGKSRGILLPIRIDDVEPPLGFGLIQAADLRGWNGDRTDQRFLHVLAAVGSVLKGEPPKGLEAPA
ncbi:MAG: toll/interleukin-1 receptor domain-containing protein, partial [Pseudomonadota bacterium]